MTYDYDIASREAWELHMQGLAPSQIADELGIEPDTARRMVCERWAREKALHQMADGIGRLADG